MSILFNKKRESRANGHRYVPRKVTFNTAMIAEAIHDSKAYEFSVKEKTPFD